MGSNSNKSNMSNKSNISNISNISTMSTMGGNSNMSNISTDGNNKAGQGMFFDFSAVAWRNVDFPWVGWLQQCYPDVNVKAELTQRMPVWLMRERKRRGKKKRWDRFITNWLSRSQQRIEDQRRHCEAR